MYLSEEQLIHLLSLGKSVEQWIGTDLNADYVVLKWLRIDKEKDDSYSVSYFEMFDDGDEGFNDVYEFSPLDPDEPYGSIVTFSSYDDALMFCIEKYNCKNNRYVNAGYIQDEYLRYLRSSKSS